MSKLFLDPTIQMESVQASVGYTDASSVPMTLMFGHPQNAAKLGYKHESAIVLKTAFGDILRERAETLTYVVKESLNTITSAFNFDARLGYELTTVSYTTLAGVQLQNIIGLKANMFEYIQKIDQALDLSVNILDIELAALTRAVAELITSKDALTSTRPTKAITELKMYTTDVGSFKGELAKMIGPDNTTEFLTYGSIYYSNKQWEEGAKITADISRRLKKIKIERYAKDVGNLTALIDKLLIRMNDVEVPKENIRLYSELLEESSANVAFAGATIHMAQTVLTTMNNHNEILRGAVDDIKKNKKMK